MIIDSNKDRLEKKAAEDLHHHILKEERTRNKNKGNNTHFFQQMEYNGPGGEQSFLFNATKKNFK